tara:strand:+ start:1129 stop:1305 length:177 start_codon:yes stop_codon:yes gene_type:complete
MIKYVKSLYWAAIIVYGSGAVIFPILYYKSGNILNLALGIIFLLMLIKECKEYRKSYK